MQEPTKQPLLNLICVLLPGFNLHSLLSVTEPAQIANQIVGHALCDISFVGFDGDPVTAHNGMALTCAAPDLMGPKDVAIVFGSLGAEHYQNPAVLSWLRLQHRRGAHLGAVEEGAFVLARSGLLDGVSATTHWRSLPGFRERFPNVQTVEQVFCENGRVFTCAGGSAGTDLMLQLLAKFCGPETTERIAAQLLHPAIRSSDNAQRSEPKDQLATIHPNVRAAVALMQHHLDEPLGIPDIAKRVGISQRQLERQFTKDLSLTAVQYGLRLRLQQAAVLLATTDMSILDISVATGFNSVSHFVTRFKDLTGKRPSASRQTAPEFDLVLGSNERRE